jgi:hypothetical protein
MKMWWVSVKDSRYLCGEKEKEFFVRVFKEECIIEEIELPENNGSNTLVGDE